jgi:pantoate--beta-alanine ligase
MGALHNGHLSLIKSSKENCDLTVCSIFVNPTQFNDPKDFEKYPVTIADDILKLETIGTDILFLPSVNEMYPEGLHASAHIYQLGYLEQILEGFYRPGHFQGVCQVVHKLLNIVEPNSLFMGQKDYQQCMVIKKLIADFHLPVELIIQPTIRENEGLAMSSRNMRLSAAAQKSATAVYASLLYIKEHLSTLSFDELKSHAAKHLLSNGFEKIDYIEICNADDLSIASVYQTKSFVALIAAFINGIRLIDNIVIE